MAKSSKTFFVSLLLILTSASISGCATRTVYIPECTWSEAIYPSREDVLTPGTKQQIVIQNESWEHFCGK